jgi:hypothetical protein
MEMVKEALWKPKSQFFAARVYERHFIMTSGGSFDG